MSSSVGSLTRQSGTAPEQTVGPVAAAYSPSKTFLNAITVQYVRELSGTDILINACCPGYVATDLNDFHGVRTPEQGAAIAIELAPLPDDGPTGKFFEDAGEVPGDVHGGQHTPGEAASPMRLEPPRPDRIVQEFLPWIRHRTGAPSRPRTLMNAPCWKAGWTFTGPHSR